MTTSFRLFSTLRYDPQLIEVPRNGPNHAGWNYHNESPIYLLDYHRDRLLNAASYWGWEDAVKVLEGATGLESLIRGLENSIGPSQTSSLRLKILVDRHGEVEFEKFHTPSVPLEHLFPSRLPSPEEDAGPHVLRKHPQYVLIKDSQSTVRSEHTHFKTTNRAMYDAARERAMISPGELKEVLTVSSDGYVMEASITTPYFWRGGRWVTPPVSRGYSDTVGNGGQEGTSRRWALER